MENRILVFAHMMKTAGTSLSKQLIGNFGKRIHIVPGGMKMDHDYYDAKLFQKDLQKLGNKLSIISGHPMRPYIDFQEFEERMEWFTIFRKPENRYVSHFLHDYKWTDGFAYGRYREMKEKSIVEWEKIENYANYQTKFIAGEPCYDKAIEILETKIKWVGITEEYADALCSFQHFFKLANFGYEIEASNNSLADVDLKKKILKEYADFIRNRNEIDNRLYDYVVLNLWPKYRVAAKEKCEEAKGKPKLLKQFNMLQYQLNRQFKFRTEEINLQNLKRFYKRWYR